MARNADGSATCDRCGISLLGFGLVYGLICDDLEPSGAARQHIYCYVNNCRAAVLNGLIFYPTGSNCAHCGLALPVRSVATAMLTADLHPNIPGEPRNLMFCYANGSRDLLLAKGVL